MHTFLNTCISILTSICVVNERKKVVWHNQLIVRLVRDKNGKRHGEKEREGDREKVVIEERERERVREEEGA